MMDFPHFIAECVEHVVNHDRSGSSQASSVLHARRKTTRWNGLPYFQTQIYNNNIYIYAHLYSHTNVHMIIYIHIYNHIYPKMYIHIYIHSLSKYVTQLYYDIITSIYI